MISSRVPDSATSSPEPPISRHARIPQWAVASQMIECAQFAMQRERGAIPRGGGDPRIQPKGRHGLRTFAQTGAVRGGEGRGGPSDSCTRGGRREDGDGAAKPRRQRHRRQGPLRVCAVYVHGRWVSRCWRRCGDAPSEGRWGVLRTGVLSRRFNAARGRVRACGPGWSLCHSWGAQAGVDAGKGNRATYRGNRSAPGTMHRACGAHGRLRVQWSSHR